MINIFCFDMKNYRVRKMVSFVAEYANVMYMSERNIYLAFRNYKQQEAYTTIHKSAVQ